MTCRTLVAGCLASLSAALLFAAPIAGQPGRDLLAPEPRAAVRAERLDLVDRTSMLPAWVRSVASTSGTDGLVGVAQPATELYSYDDDSFEGFLWLVDRATGELLYAMEFAQRFQLRAAGTVELAEACMLRPDGDTEPIFNFSLTFYSDAGGTPGDVVRSYPLQVRYEGSNELACIEATGILGGLPVDAGQIWLGVSWRRGSPPENTKRLALDEDSSGGGRAFRARPEEGDAWEGWQPDGGPGVYGLRLAVNHPDPTPDPTPDPEPDPEPDPGPDPDPDAGPPTGPGYTNCVPQTTPLVFDGGYNVQMCYETSQGVIGDGKAGIWASGEAGLLWFFNQDNAEVLIKVLESACRHVPGNEHVWVYVAPVTDLAFNLYVTHAESRRTWRHYNRQGDTASTRSDKRAFPCNN